MIHIMITTPVVWRDCQTDPPDDETTVLIFMPDADEPVWLGWKDGDRWHEYQNHKHVQPKLWAHVPHPDTKPCEHHWIGDAPAIYCFKCGTFQEALVR